MNILIETRSVQDRNAALEKIHALGTISDRYPDGSFLFKPYDEECTDEATEVLEENNIECM